MHLTIYKKGFLLISLPLILQLVFLAFLFRNRAATDAADRLALQSREVLATADDAFALTAQAQSATRALIITANPRFAAESESAVAAARRRFEILRNLVADDPVQLARAREIERAAEDLFAWIGAERDLVAAGDVDEAAARVKNLSGATRLAAVRAAVDAFVTEEDRIAADRTVAAAAARASQGWALALSAVGAAAVTLAAVHLFNRSVAGRLAVVTANARQLAENAPLNAPLPGSDEIAALDAVLHDSARRLAAAAESEAAYKADIEHRAADLARTNESLRQQTAENEMFVYSVSHDLRSPLVNLQGFSKELLHAGDALKAILADPRVPDDLRARAADVLDADVADSVRFIRSAVTRSSGIIDALLRLSRAGRVEYRWQTVDLNPVIARIVDALQSTIELKHATVTVRGPLAPAYGDATALEHVFANLIGNAVNYLSPDRPGVIEIGMRDDGRPDPDTNLRTYYVRDNGLGIPAAYLPKVFTAFQRLHGDVAKGEGIGLALVRRTVERHAGRAAVESVDGQGTTFLISLPADPSRLPATPAPTMHAPPPTTNPPQPATDNGQRTTDN